MFVVTTQTNGGHYTTFLEMSGIDKGQDQNRIKSKVDVSDFLSRIICIYERNESTLRLRTKSKWRTKWRTKCSLNSHDALQNDNR